MVKSVSNWEFAKILESRKILVIDDFGDMRNMLVNIMRMLGARDIDSAINGERAIEAMEANKYDIVLCDYNLGKGKDGQQVLEEVRHRQLINRSTIFIMVTAESTKTMVMGAIEHEPDSYVSKPFSKDLIKARIERAMLRKDDFDAIFQAVDAHQLDKAIVLLDNKIKQKPKNLSELMRLKADICLQAGDLKTSEDIYKQVLALREVPWAKLGLGKVYFKRKDFAKAAEIFSELVQVNPDFTIAMDWHAKCLTALGRVDDAKSVLASALEVSPRGILRQELFGDLSMQTGDFEKAEKAFSQAVKLGKNSVHNHPSFYANLAKSQTSLDKHDEALKSIGRIQRNFGDDKNADIYTATAEALVYHNKGDAEKSAEAMKKASALYEISGDMADNKVTLELAKVASSLGDTEKTEALLKKAIQNNHDDDEFLSSVTSLLHTANLGHNPDDFVAGLRKEVIEMNNRGVQLLQKGEYDKAVALFEEAAEQMSSNSIIVTNTIRALLTRMEKQGAENSDLFKVRQHLDRLKRIDPGNAAIEATTQKLTARLKRLLEG